jgi:3,4-dihydroxy 2-butanone 4-phosphate synthase / GTP cyclohydrolase II
MLVTQIDRPAALDAPTSALRRGDCVVILSRQPVLMAPARGITAATINLMAREARGLVCHAMTAARMLELGLPLIPARQKPAGRGEAPWRFAVSYEAGQGCSTGISAADRALTLNAGAAEEAGPGSIATPGHIIPVLGDYDAASTLGHAPSDALRMLRHAGLGGGAAICTLLDGDGAVADAPAAEALADRLGVCAVAVCDLGLAGARA